ncbi:class II glutamine amidotransferase [Peribacillus sp. NPDC046944]|uniref:class II glutamine amidotransferase n=1 Tax=unclassified Peribacillus TaxID=2675266 RepID=UPI003CFC919E
MCELLIVKSQNSIPMEWVLGYAKLLDEYGLGGFSWGVAWKDTEGELRCYKSVDGIRKDQQASERLKGITSKEIFIHLRRPSLMNSITPFNIQPYLTTDHSLAFGHNGNFEEHESFRSSFLQLLKGTSDSEIAFQYFFQHHKKYNRPVEALEETHRALKGKANMALFRKNEATIIYSGNVDNKMYSFQLDDIKCVSTSVHSHDDFVFQNIFPSAKDIRRLPLFTSLLLE